MSWKQPIDTAFYEEFGKDHAGRDLWFHILLNTQNEDMKTPVLINGKKVQLKRGQFLYGRNKFAELIRLSPSGTDRAFIRLQEVYSKVTSTRNTNGTVGTVLNYDFVVGLDKQSDKQVTTKKQASNTPKSVRVKDIISKEIISIVLKYDFSEQLHLSVLRYLEDMHKRGGAFKKTAHAVELFCSRLAGELSKEFNESELIASIDEAIERGWKKLFPKKIEFVKQHSKKTIERQKIESYASDAVEHIAHELGKRPNGFYDSASKFVAQYLSEKETLPPPNVLLNFVRLQMTAKSTAPP